MNNPIRGIVAAALAVGALVVPTALPPSVADAAGDPDVVLSKSTPAEVLYGDTIPATLTATTVVGETTDGYNLSFTDTLPEGAIFGASTPAPTTIIDLPGATGTAIVWENVADLLAGASVSLTYTYTVDDSVFDIGDDVINNAGAYVSSDPRDIPDFDPVTGANIANAQTDGFDTATASTTLIPFELTKVEPNTETELLRGVHDHKTVFTLTVDNNQLLASSDFVLVDYLPAGLEFLECGDVDNSLATTEEYPTSGRIDATPAPLMTNACPVPSSVSTVTDPVVDGTPLPGGVYTRVEWDAATLVAASATDDLTPTGLAATDSFSIDYVAAIPLRENVQASLTDTAANLDNNTGALTTDEQSLTNFAFVTGTTDAVAYSDDDTWTTSAEDLSIHKSVDVDSFVHGADAVWTFEVESSEYAVSTDTVITVTDTIPNGAAYSSTDMTLSNGPFLGPTGVAPFDGTQIVEWEIPAYAAANSSTTWTMTTTALEDYRAPAAGPVSANDGWTNSVELTADATLITDNDGSTTSGITLPDESSASQSAADVSITKEVADPAPAPVTCGDGAAPMTFDETVAYDYRAGDRVCWRLTVDFPLNLDTLSPLVKDFLPLGYSYESWSFGENNNFGVPVGGGAPVGVNFVSTVDDIADGILIWDLDDADPTGDTFEVVVSTLLDDTASLGNADITTNLMKFSFVNTDGSLFQLRTEADARYIEPILAMTKGHTPAGPFVGGDTVDYSVTVTNTGFLEAENATITDDLPTGIDCDDVTLGAVTLPVVATCPTGTSTITWTGVDVPAGSEEAPTGSGVLETPGTVSVAYSVLLPTTYNPGASVTNDAAVTDYETPTNTGTATSVIGGPSDSDTIPITNAQLTKTRTTGLNQTGNSTANQATIGESITYTVTATIPGGTTTVGGVITDTMPAGVRLDSASVLMNSGPAPGTFVSDASGFTLTLPAPYSNASGDDVFVFTVTSTVTDGALVAGNTPRNAARFSWAEGPLTAGRNTTIVEPVPAVAKANNTGDDLVTPGEFVQYTLTVSTTGSAANDVVVVDTLPDDIIPLVGPGPAADVADGGTVASGGVWDDTANTITWDTAAVAALATVSAGSPVDLVYDTRINNPITGDIMLTNDVALTATSTPGANSDERSYSASASDTVTAPSLSIESKTASPTSATIGDTVDYTVVVDIPADVIGYDLTVIDTLPPGTAFDSLQSVACAEPGPAVCGPPRTASAISASGDTGAIGFFIGDINPASAEGQKITLVYRVRVLDDDTNVTAPADLVNTVRSYHNVTDEVLLPTSVPADPATAYDNESAPRTATVGVIEPALVIDKDVSGQTGDTDTRRHQPGDTATFTIRVENTGTSPAHDVVVTDTPDSRLTGFTPAAGISTTANTDGTPGDGSLAWLIPGPIQPGAANAITLTYTLDIPNTLGPADEVVSGSEVSNTADVPQYFGHPVATRTANPTVAYREYGAGAYDVTGDTVGIELDLARIGDRVWYDIDGDGVQDPGEPGLNGVDITVTYLGTNGVLGGGDDETFSAVTSGDGDWQVIELPGGEYTVDVDIADIPAGLTPSWDRDDLLVSPDGDWQGSLAQNGDRGDVDAGFSGAGSIGNLVWFDQDLSGAQNGTEPGLGGLDVTLVWGGPDNDLLTTADNVTYTDVTAPDGSYLFDALPAGNFQVTVDGADLPTGMSFVSAPDAGTADGVSLTTLTASGPGASDLTRDFGAAGALTIGDTIYLDRDGSGDQAVTGEPGLEGVTVTLTYAGADGILGGAGAADDIVFTDVTDSNGEYGFANLPPEDYRITVAGPLPSGSVNTDDPDTVGTGDSTSVVALSADDFDQDFGYSADSAIGNRVWWDLDRDGVQEAGEPGINGATVTVTYLGPDNAAGGGDDLVFTTTTSGDGDWSVTNIPDGDYTVAVTAGIPADFDATYDDDSGTTSPDGTSDTTLTTLDNDQDFGYAGNSSIGDTIWLDRDGDGTIDADESGIPDVTVRITWAGPDGSIATTTDNVVFDRTTDDDGMYSVVGLPAGTYEITVDPNSDSLPGNVSVTYDAVNGTTGPSSTALVALASGAARTDVDFGFQGDSSIGDNIYWDRNGDGNRDTPGDDSDEPGLGGVTVQLVWAGPDGDLLTTADNSTYTTITDNDGNYLFGGLPEGEYEVNVTAGLPAGMTNTDDEDADNDSSTPVTLGANDDHATADFGYNGSATIGDTVYLDLDGNTSQALTGEPGVPGQTVTLNFEGADGNLGTLDDIVLTTVTDANGEYSFTNVPDGEFRITVVGGITDDASNSGDPDGATPNQSDVDIVGGADNLDQDFGYEGDNALGDTIWWDMNRDGIIDAPAEEPRLAGVDVRITYAGADGILGGLGAADDIVISTETTGTAGDYAVDRLPDGDYSVEVITSTLPAGMDNTFDADGGTATPDDVSLVNLPGATTDDLQDFGYAGTGSIGDLVYFDRDGDGIRGAPLDEPGIAGVELTLTFAGADGILGGAGAADDIVVTQIAGSDGEYDFTGLPAGDYTVEVSNGIPTTAINSDDPDEPGAPDAGDSISSVTLGTGEDDDTQDFGYDVEAGLGDRVWWDFDRDGVQDPAAPGSPREPGINGVEVTVTYFGLDGVRDIAPGGDDEVFVTTTSGDGDWMVIDIPEGNYAIELTGGVPAGFTNTYDPDTGVTAPDGTTVLAGHTDLNVIQDFGLAGDSSIGDVVWLDLDGDGTINGQEVGLEGVTVDLTWGGPDGIVGGANGADDVIISVVNDADGNYLFEGLPAGAYDVTVDPTTLPDGLSPSYDLDGDTTTPDGSTPVVLGATDTLDTIDFGFQGGSRIGDTLFLDRDRDGVHDVGGNGDEPGLNGVIVTLTWEGENGIFGDGDDETFATVTDPDGFYEFTGLPAGEYQVDVDTTPTGGLPVAVDNTVDEDGNSNSSTPVTLGVDDDHDTADFGYAGIAAIGDTIFLDLDGDGVQTGSEPGVPGQTVTLTGAQGTFTTVTDADGMYSFDNLPDGDYDVTVVGGIVASAANTGDPDSAAGAGDNTSMVTIAGGISDDIQDFGYQGTAGLGDTLFFDVDDDGVDDGDATEPRLDGVDVVVLWFGPDGVIGGGDDIVIPTLPTDVDGVYGATGLPSGTYSVTPDADDILPGLTPTADADGGSDGTSTVTLADSEVDLDQDFAYTGTGSIGDAVWLDTNDDGVLDAGELGLEGVTVTVTWLGPDGIAGGDDDVVYSTTVADDGTYLIENLPAGEFTVELSGVPDGLTGATTATTTLDPGEEDLDQDFPFVGSAGVGDTVFLDVDDDGIQGPGEPGVGGVSVTVTSAGSDGILGTADDLEFVTTTASDGTYTVTGLPAGPTQVDIDQDTLLPGTVPTADADGGDPAVSVLDLGTGENDVDQDFAIAGDGVIGGTVIDEGDGSGIADVLITITYDGPDGPLVITTTSGPDGSYGVTGLPVGGYTVEVAVGDQPDGYIPTGPTSVDVTISAGDPTPPRVDFPFVPPGSIGRTIYVDQNRNGVQDPGELGAFGVSVTLLDADGNVIATTTTDRDGSFIFENLPPGTYTVVLDPDTFPPGLVLTVDPDGNNDGRFVVTIGPGENSRAAIFGLAPPVLPSTGSGVGVLLRVATLLLAAGAVLLLLRRRRSDEDVVTLRL